MHRKASKQKILPLSPNYQKLSNFNQTSTLKIFALSDRRSPWIADFIEVMGTLIVIFSNYHQTESVTVTAKTVTATKQRERAQILWPLSTKELTDRMVQQILNSILTKHHILSVASHQLQWSYFSRQIIGYFACN